jgi:hypothetical protein
MEIETARVPIKKLMSFNELPEDIVFYMTEVFQFSFYKLFITGVMENGQTINIVAN